MLQPRTASVKTPDLKKMDGVTTLSIEPASRDAQYAMLVSLAVTFTAYLFTIITAGTSSGKARCIAGQSQKWVDMHAGGALVIINAYTEQIAETIREEHTLHGFIVHTLQRDTSHVRLIKQVNHLLASRVKQVIIYHGHSHTRGEFTAVARAACALFDAFKELPILYQIDEIHAQITQLTGGINGTILRYETHMDKYRKVLQQTSSLNFFDMARRHGNVRAIGWSATNNNLLSSKLGSCGYNYKDILSVNVKPIPSLYPSAEPTVFDLDDMKEMVHLMREEEKKGRVILIIGSSTTWLDTLVRVYEEEVGVKMLYVEITCRMKYTDEEHLRHRLATTKYVLGIRQVAVGFNLATYTSGNFGAVFMCKKCSDRGSQPLSRNPVHKLHCGLSADYIQAIGRCRDSSCTLYVTSRNEGVRLIDALERVNEIVEEAGNEAARYGPVGDTQSERMHHQIYVSLCQNIRESGDNIPTVTQVLRELRDITGRNLEEELLRDDCDHMFWRSQIAVIWQSSAGIMTESVRTPIIAGVACAGAGIAATSSRHSSDTGHSVSSAEGCDAKIAPTHLSAKQLITSVTDNPSATSAPLLTVHEHIKGGGGERDVRITLLAEIEEMERRAEGVCACCSEPFVSKQMAHIYPHDQGGSATADNMVLAHQDCHATMDAGTLIFDPTRGGYWCKRRYMPSLHAPQIKGISIENLIERWRWHRRELPIPEGIQMGPWLDANGYVFTPCPALFPGMLYNPATN